MTSREFWMPIPGYEGAYAVSDQGNVKSIGRTIVRSDGAKPYLTKTKILAHRLCGAKAKPHERRNMAALRKDNMAKSIPVCALMLMAFVGPRPPLHHSCHKDGEISHNNLGNLYWGLPIQNMRDRGEHGRTVHGLRIKGAKLSNDDVRLIRKLGAEGHTSYAIDQMGVVPISHSAIMKVLRNITWRHVK